jgi:hypothetical protein
VEYQTRIAEIESAVRLLKVARPFEADLHRLRVHLRMVQEDARRMGYNHWFGRPSSRDLGSFIAA